MFCPKIQFWSHLTRVPPSTCFLSIAYGNLQLESSMRLCMHSDAYTTWDGPNFPFLSLYIVFQKLFEANQKVSLHNLSKFLICLRFYSTNTEATVFMASCYLPAASAVPEDNQDLNAYFFSLMAFKTPSRDSKKAGCSELLLAKTPVRILPLVT